nr:hypothetical protein [Mobiluncus sp. Marseille-Q7826]
MRGSHIVVHHRSNLDELPRRIKSQADNFVRVVVFDYLAHKNAERLFNIFSRTPMFQRRPVDMQFRDLILPHKAGAGAAGSQGRCGGGTAGRAAVVRGRWG